MRGTAAARWGYEYPLTQIDEVVHGEGGLLYYEGANLKGGLVKYNPGIMRLDGIHMNLQNNLSTAHGGGGAGAGAMGVSDR